MNEFEEIVKGQTRTGVLADFWYFLRHDKKWWMTPLMLMPVLAGVLMLLGGTAVAPFIYSFF